MGQGGAGWAGRGPGLGPVQSQLINNSSHLLRASEVPGPVLSAFCASSHFLLTKEDHAFLLKNSKDRVTCLRSQS